MPGPCPCSRRLLAALPRSGPVAGRPLGLELLAGGLAADPPFGVLLPFRVPGRPDRLVQAQVAAPRPGQQLGAGADRRLPVEDDGLVALTDQHGVAGAGA